VSTPAVRSIGMFAVLKIGPVQVVAPLLLISTPTIADITNDLAHCQLEAERLLPSPTAKAPQNWSDRAVNLQKQAEWSKLACGRQVIALLLNVQLPSRLMRAV
jgi:hypothetical protein